MVRKRQQKRRRILINKILESWVGFIVVAVISLFLKYFEIDNIPYSSTLTLIGALSAVQAIILVIVTAKRFISEQFFKIISFLLFLVLFTAFNAWIFTLHEMRIIGIFLLCGGITFQLTLRFYGSLLYSISFVAGYIIVSYIAINYFNKGGDFRYEVMYAACFSLILMYLSFISGRLHKKKTGIKYEKELLEKLSTELFTETQIAKMIQSKLIPENPGLTGYDMSAMVKRDREIMGDYYDIIHLKDRDWIVMGYISGEDLTSGLIMMMVQTSINTAIVQNPDIPPSRLFEIINTILAENIKRIGKERYIKLTILARCEDNCWQFSGLHQDIILFRKEKGEIERITGDNAVLGITDHIETGFTDKKITMNSNDIMILHSNETVHENLHDGMNEKPKEGSLLFETDKLTDLLSGKNGESADEIRNGIVEQYKIGNPNDDLALLIIKKE